MSQITLSSSPDSSEAPKKKTALSTLSEQCELDAELFPELYQQKIQEVIELSQLPATKVKLMVQPVYEIEGVKGQFACLQLADRNVTFYSVTVKMHNREVMQNFMKYTMEYFQFVAEKHAYSVQLGRMIEINFNTLLYTSGIELSAADRQSSTASRISLTMGKGIMTNIARMIAQSVIDKSGGHHQLRMADSEDDAVHWLFDGIEQEMGLK